MLLTKQYFVDLRKYVQDKLEAIIKEEATHKPVHIQPLKISLMNISLFCTNAIIDMEEEDMKKK